MGDGRIQFNRNSLSLGWRAMRDFASSEVRGKAAGLALTLIAFLVTINGLNVVNSFVGRDFMTAIENRDWNGFVRGFLTYFAVFAASTVVAVLNRYAEERLGLLWREWLTRRLVSLYLCPGTSYRLMVTGRITNPDQRIADDIRSLTTTALAFVLMLLNATFTIVAFSGVIWTISPVLFGVAVLYAGIGSLLTIALGGRLVRLNYDQADKEAQLRGELIHVREHADSILLARAERSLLARLSSDIDSLNANQLRIIGVNRNVSFFTTIYNYLIQIIPALIVAPMFIRGAVEFGVITQASMAFTHLLGAFSLVITQFQQLSSLAAVIARVASLREAIEEVQTTSETPIATREADGCVAYEHLTLLSPSDQRKLVDDLTVTIDAHTRVLVVGPNQTAKIALFRATIGVWSAGSGGIVRPGLDRILLLPERAYLPPGTLRTALGPTSDGSVQSDAEIFAILSALDLDFVITRVGGLDTERDWHSILSLGEQHLLACARILIAKPQFAFLDRPGTALDRASVERILRLMTQSGITYIHFADGDCYPHLHDMVLAIDDDGAWRWRPPIRERAEASLG